jgi:hypothetical protein
MAWINTAYNNYAIAQMTVIETQIPRWLVVLSGNGLGKLAAAAAAPTWPALVAKELGVTQG